MKHGASRLIRSTTVYGLVDPRTGQLRYVGKTVLRPAQRLASHIRASRVGGTPARWWMRSLLRAETRPEIIVLEMVEPGGDWIEAGQFWIAYFKMVGANLCNMTLGGDGHAGLKCSASAVAKRTAASRTEASRLRLSVASKERWKTQRTALIDAQNSGKGLAWRARQVELGKLRCASPDSPLRRASEARKKVTDAEVSAIRARLACGEQTGKLAVEYGLHQSTISHIRSGRDREITS